MWRLRGLVTRGFDGVGVAYPDAVQDPPQPEQSFLRLLRSEPAMIRVLYRSRGFRRRGPAIPDAADIRKLQDPFARYYATVDPALVQPQHDPGRCRDVFRVEAEGLSAPLPQLQQHVIDRRVKACGRDQYQGQPQWEQELAALPILGTVMILPATIVPTPSGASSVDLPDRLSRSSLCRQ